MVAVGGVCCADNRVTTRNARQNSPWGNDLKALPQRLKPSLKQAGDRSGKPLRHPKAKSSAESGANAKTLAGAAVESHSCAKNAIEWGTHWRTPPPEFSSNLFSP